MVGTAALPHILMRYYTVPSVREAQAVGHLVAVVHLPAVLHGAGPGRAGEVRNIHRVVGMPFDQLAGPGSVPGAGSTRACCRWPDINRDNILQLNEMTIGGDIIVLLTPELAGCPM
jgi:cation/acetate symporter